MNADGIRALAKSGTLQRDDLLADEGSDRWQRAGDVKGLSHILSDHGSSLHAATADHGTYDLEAEPDQRFSPLPSVDTTVPYAGRTGGGAVAPGVRALNRSYEAQLLNRWAWRLFIFGCFLPGPGILIQIPALYLAARASAMSGGRWGERLWRAARNWLILLYLLPIVGILLFVDHALALNDGDSSTRINALLVGLGIVVVAGMVPLTVFFWGTRPDDPVKVPRQA